MRILPIRALLGASLALGPGIALAEQAHRAEAPITVEAAPTSLQEWSSRVGRNLTDNLIYPEPFGRTDYAEGAVKVAFHCSESGAPVDVSVLRTSRSKNLDQAALTAVKRISTLHPLPDGIGHDRAMQAWVFFAADQQSLNHMKKGFEREYQLAQKVPQEDRQTAMLPPLIIASR